jgi:hypothetical protein
MLGNALGSNHVVRFKTTSGRPHDTCLEFRRYVLLTWRVVSIGLTYLEKLATFRLKQGDELSLGSPPREEDQLFSPSAQHRMDFHFPSITEIEETVVINAPTVRSLSRRRHIKKRQAVRFCENNACQKLVAYRNELDNRDLL